MREKINEVKEIFVKNDSNVIIDVSKKRETLEYVKVRTLEQENKISSWWQIIKGQICHMNKTILWMHLAICIGIVVLIWTNWFDIHSWEKLGMIISGVLGALSFLEVGSLFFSRVTELEATCYFNVRQLATFQMTYSGFISLAALMIFTIFTNIRLEKDILMTGIYILVPFVSTECICMTIMLTEIGRRNILLLIATGIFSAFFWGILASMPVLYEASATVFWIVALLAGIGIFAMQIKRFFSVLEKGEILCAD